MFRKKSIIKKLLPYPIEASHQEYSMIVSAHDDKATATPSLLKLSFDAIQKAHTADLEEVNNRLKQPPYYINIWPGEHYKLLAGLVLTLQPKIAIEIGTASGLSILSLKKYMPRNSKLVTFDVFPWEDDENSILKKEDFEKGKLFQYVEDLSDDEIFKKHTSLFENAELIFIDAIHDGDFENNLMEKFKSISFKNPPYIVLDDIRVWKMLKMWRDIKHPKLDITSFGHWSGTGIVEWQNS